MRVSDYNRIKAHRHPESQHVRPGFNSDEWLNFSYFDDGLLKQAPVRIIHSTNRRLTHRGMMVTRSRLVGSQLEIVDHGCTPV